MTLQLQPTITKAGLSAVINANGDGVSAKVTHIAFGSAAYTPSSGATSLLQEQERAPITFSMKDGPGSFRVRGVTPPLETGAQEYWVREVGVFLDDGTLLAVWADPATAITGRGRGAELEFDFKLMLDALPDGSIEIVVTPGGDRTLSALSALAARAIAAERRSLNDYLALQAMASRVDALEQGAAVAGGDRAILRKRVSDNERQADADRLASQILGVALSAQSIRHNRITLPHNAV